jgi:hypothetical protein
MIAITSMKWALTASDMDSLLRNYLKYGHKFKDVDEAIESIRKSLHGFMKDKNIFLEMIGQKKEAKK